MTIPGLMQQSPVEIKRRLLSALDNDNNVVDVSLVREIMATLEQMHITKEALETTRLGKHINEMRKKTQDVSLARRAKALVRRWRDMILPPSEPTAAPAAVVRRCSPPAPSCPSSASTSPGLPLPGRQPPSKSDVANKRKRKPVEAGWSRVNGRQEDECSRDSITCEFNACPPTIDLCADDDSPPAVKKPRRSRSAASEPSFAELNEKLALASRRVKTTRELLSDLAERSGDGALALRASQFPERPAPCRPTPVRKPPTPANVHADKGELMQRFLSEQSGPPSPVPNPQTPPLPTPAEILARLPRLDEASIVWQEQETAPPPPAVPPHEAHRLSREPLENVTGNSDWRGRFREWHETVLSGSQQYPLPMLPYVITD